MRRWSESGTPAAHTTSDHAILRILRRSSAGRSADAGNDEYRLVVRYVEKAHIFICWRVGGHEVHGFLQGVALLGEHTYSAALDLLHLG